MSDCHVIFLTMPTCTHTHKHHKFLTQQQSKPLLDDGPPWNLELPWPSSENPRTSSALGQQRLIHWFMKQHVPISQSVSQSVLDLLEQMAEQLDPQVHPRNVSTSFLQEANVQPDLFCQLDDFRFSEKSLSWVSMQNAQNWENLNLRSSVSALSSDVFLTASDFQNSSVNKPDQTHAPHIWVDKHPQGFCRSRVHQSQQVEALGRQQQKFESLFKYKLVDSITASNLTTTAGTNDATAVLINGQATCWAVLRSDPARSDTQFQFAKLWNPKRLHVLNWTWCWIGTHFLYLTLTCGLN